MTTATTKSKAYSYVRFSTPEQMKGDSFDRQTRKAVDYAHGKGLELDTALTFQDLGVSAFRGKNAETGAIRAFRNKVEEGDIPEGSYLLVESLDRLSRNAITEAQGLFLSIIGAGITIVTLIDKKEYSKGSVDANPIDIITAILVMIRAHEESDTKSKRLSSVYESKRARAASGEKQSAPFTRMLPAWIYWDDNLKKHAAHKERAAIVRDIFRKANGGWGQHKIARWLNEQGTPTWGRAAHWHRTYIKKILENPAVIGTFTPHRKLVDPNTRKRVRKPQAPIEGYFPAVVERDVFDGVALRQAGIAPRGRHANQEVKNLFGGLMRCSQCEATVTRITKGKWVYLVCAKANSRAGSHPYQAVTYEYAEEVFREAAFIENAPRGQSTEELETKIEDCRGGIFYLEDEMEEIADELISNRSDTLRRKLREGELELERLRAELQALEVRREALTPANVQKRLQALLQALTQEPFDVAHANRALKQAVRQIVMDVERATLSIEWHHVDPETPGQLLFFISRHKRWDNSEE